MSTTFLIEAKSRNVNGHLLTLPSQDFGDTCVRMIDFWDWSHFEDKPYIFKFIEYTDEPTLIDRFKQYDNAIPIGSVEFVLAWFKVIGIKNVKPLNIPKELWHFCDREIAIGHTKDFNGVYMLKDLEVIKSEYNDCVKLNNNIYYPEDKEFFLSEWLNDVISEWRVFVFNGEIKDIKCYSGDFWKLPDKDYIEKIVKEYNNPSYTLDVMVTPNKTEILELHDFFSCGLYGFEDTILPLMWKRSIKNIIKRYKNI